MIELDSVYAGPAINKLEKFNPLDIVVRLIDENPGASRDVLEKLFIEEVEEDKDYRRPALKYYFQNNWKTLMDPRPRARRAKNERQEAETRRAVAEDVQKLKRAIIISELLMPNNKKVADCTGVEMGKFGKFGAKVAKIVKRRKVGVVLTEEQLYKLWQESK